MEVSFRAGSAGEHELYVTVPDDQAAALGRPADVLARECADQYAAHNNYTVDVKSSGHGLDVDGVDPARGDATHFVFAMTEVVAPAVADATVKPAVVAPVSTASTSTSAKTA